IRVWITLEDKVLCLELSGRFPASFDTGVLLRAVGTNTSEFSFVEILQMQLSGIDAFL
ncbi:unnamed protein product, partial [Heterotrigona itama]